MNEIQHAEKLQENGLFNTYSALQHLNFGKPKKDHIKKKDFYEKLRRAGFLSLGMTKKPHDPTHNKPLKWIREKGWARIETLNYETGEDIRITHSYNVAIYTMEGMDIIEKIINDENFCLHKQRYLAEKPKPAPKPTIDQVKKNDAAGLQSIAEIKDLLKAG